MPDVRQLQELTRQVRPPELTDLADLADVRRRRAGAGLAVGLTACMVLLAILAGTLGGGREARPSPAPPAREPTTTSGRIVPAYPLLTAEQIRDHPNATRTDDISSATVPTAAPGVAVRLWEVCFGSCTDGEKARGERQQAVEVTRDRFTTSAIYAVDNAMAIAHAVGDWFLVEIDGAPVLVDSRDHRRPLTLSTPISIDAVPGPVVYTAQGLASINLTARTLHLVEVDGGESWNWQGAGDTWHWGTAWLLMDGGKVTRVAVTWRKLDGTFGVNVLPIGVREGGPGMLIAKRSGTMAVVDHYGSPRRVHISTDYGATWQSRRLPVDVPSAGQLPSDWTTWPRE